MVFYPVAFALLLHILFWGAGLAWLVTPRIWKSFWPLFAGLAGVALQSGVVWAGAYVNLQGTESYGRLAEVLPAGLLAFAWWREGSPGWKAWLRVAGVVVLMVIVLSGVIASFAASSKILTTSSIGSCDAADYAAGARVLSEFARSDREGFIGLTEVVRVHSVDNFFDFWLRLNHFTPSAIVALNGSAFGLKAYQLISVAVAVFLALGIPIVFWLARFVMGFDARASLYLGAIYGVSPLLVYAVAHASMSQLLAAPAIALVNGCAVVLWRMSVSWTRLLSVAGLLAIGFWLILGAYNFIVVVCLVPAILYAVGQAVWNGQFARLFRWFVGLLAPLCLVSLLAPARVAGLLERFQLFQEYDFGWRIPMLSPEGWYGLVANPSLGGYATGIRWALSIVLGLVLLLTLAFGARRYGRQVFFVLCITLPILAAYYYLILRGRSHGTNASYDAYKLLAVFYPGILMALGFGLISRRRSGAFCRVLAIGLGSLVLAGNVWGSYRIAVRLQDPPLIVDRSLPKLTVIETMPQVASVNMLVTDFWSRLWANVFLLHRAQYFPTHTYEGRFNTELKGQWDLLGGLISVRLPGEGDSLTIEKPYSLVRVGSPYFLRAKLGDGWYDSERLARNNQHWRWTKGDAELVIENPHSRPLHVALRLQARSLIERDLEIRVNGKRLRRTRIGTDLAWVKVPSITLPPGTSLVKLTSSLPAQPASATDRRLLGFAAYGIELEVKAEPDPPEN
ncbi:MAG: hypothetical protein KBA71_13385 [Opitutaceae bacterium]|nr:hypothetical protein [Opitutaceae bacterium]